VSKAIAVFAPAAGTQDEPSYHPIEMVVPLLVSGLVPSPKVIEIGMVSPGPTYASVKITPFGAVKYTQNSMVNGVVDVAIAKAELLGSLKLLEPSKKFDQFGP
jgi:hypothetical protein